jgi:hypothetical protein
VMQEEAPTSTRIASFAPATHPIDSPALRDNANAVSPANRKIPFPVVTAYVYALAILPLGNLSRSH